MNANRQKDARDVSTLQAVILLLASLSSIGLASDEGRLSIISVVEDVVGKCFYLNNLALGKKS